MTESTTPKPTAFVIMPSGDNFAGIFEHIITPALEQAGYRVVLAVDIDNVQNIMKDIVRGLADSTLIVADLTGSNRNVYYELGIAHALGKPTILLTQDIADLPFDVRSYRVIEYDDHVGRYSNAQTTITSYAEGLLNRTTTFGNPVTDFLPSVQQEPQLLASEITLLPHEEDPAEELGVLDHALRLEEGVQALTTIIQDVGNESEEQSEFLRAETTRIQQLNERGNSTTKDRIITIQRLARGLENYANSLEGRNVEYGNVLESMQSSLEEVVRAQDVSDPKSREQLTALLTALDGGEESVQAFRFTIDETATIVDEMPSIERKFNRARNEVSKQLRYLSTNAEQTVSMMSRAKVIGQGKLEADPGSDTRN